MKLDIKIPSYSPISGIRVTFIHGNLTSLSISNSKNGKKALSVSNEMTDDEQIENLLLQLDDYFSAVKPFKSISVTANGTPFQQSVCRFQ